MGTHAIFTDTMHAALPRGRSNATDLRYLRVMAFIALTIWTLRVSVHDVCGEADRPGHCSTLNDLRSETGLTNVLVPVYSAVPWHRQNIMTRCEPRPENNMKKSCKLLFMSLMSSHPKIARALLLTMKSGCWEERVRLIQYPFTSQWRHFTGCWF